MAAKEAMTAKSLILASGMILRRIEYCATCQKYRWFGGVNATFRYDRNRRFPVCWFHGGNAV
jgi:hypothetical protein